MNLPGPFPVLLGRASIVLAIATVADPLRALLRRMAGPRLRRLARWVSADLDPRAAFDGLWQLPERPSKPAPRERDFRPTVAGAETLPERPEHRAPGRGRDRRARQRFKASFLGTLHAAAGAEAASLCDILDLSAGGARIRPVEAMPEVARVTLGLRHFGQFPAHVAWRTADEIGLSFDQAPGDILRLMAGLLPRPTPAPAH